ncbi:hypothetical protein PCAR4_200028 [Paraburkholderia caribensis]|nr:hypothetical protein PCAR4_200028 [Paraburkholderia caribensis]
MRKLDMSEHYDPLRIVSSDPSIYYVHVPSPRGVLIEMSRGTVLRVDPLAPPWQWKRCTRFSIVSFCAKKTRHLPGRSGRVASLTRYLTTPASSHEWYR